LHAQLSGWVREGIPHVKMKIGMHPDDNLNRVRQALEAIGSKVELYVDANGAYNRKQALAFADAFRALGVVWFEKPVSPDDLEGLCLIRDRAPAGMQSAAGEYGYEYRDFRSAFSVTSEAAAVADLSTVAIGAADRLSDLNRSASASRSASRRLPVCSFTSSSTARCTTG
jgi:L-alanine-DL-glutamate epimerase-like enolase superfamily enzyme